MDDQEKALRFYTEMLGLAKKSDFSQRLFQGGEGQVIFSQGGMKMRQEIRTCRGWDCALGQFALNLPRLAYLPGERQRLTQCG